MFRHGDVYLVPVTGKPAKAKRVPRDPQHGIVLAYGKQTGHAHAIADKDVWLWEANGRRFLHVPSSADTAMLDHEEHGAMPIASGWYSVIIQREYSPTEIRQVAD